MTDLIVDQVSHVYREGSVRALDRLSLELRTGECVALIGQNGSGKSTLARHLNGLLRPTEGRILIDGDDARRFTVAQLSRRVGLVFQDPDRQIFAGSVRREIEFGPRNLGLSGKDLDGRVAAALEATGLSAEAETNPYDLGMARRKLLTLASMLAMEPSVFVLDEPTTGQDLRGRERIRAVIATARDQGRTVIAISHDMEFVASVFERIVVLEAGRVVADGSPAQVFDAASWPILTSTNLQPPLAARIGARLGLGSTPTDESLIDALAIRHEDAAPPHEDDPEPR